MHATRTQSVEGIDDFEPARDIPGFLQTNLTTTENPHEIYRVVCQRKDDRVRLLTCRFFNQIQYGCKNPNCNIPTCLSYRKRVATGPVRPHNDVTARALAVRCVEQYANRGRDIDRYPRGEKNKRKYVQNIQFSNDGLCYSEPIVPWYSNGKEYLAKRNAAARLKPRPKSAGEKDVPLSSHGAHASIDSQPGPKASNGAPIDPGSGREEVSEVQLKLKPVTRLHSNERETSKETSDIQRSTADGERPLLSSPQPSQRIRTKLIDNASFAQFLFNTPSLRLEEKSSVDVCTDVTDSSPESPGWPSSGSSSGHEKVSTPDSESVFVANCQAAHNVDGVSKTERQDCSILTPEEASSSYRSFNYAKSYTFKLLPPSAIMYLKSLVLRHKMKTEQQSLSYLSKVHEFIEQSLYFVFTNPERLITSASTWDSRGIVSVEDMSPIALEANAISEAQFYNTQRPTLPAWTSVLSVCNDIFQPSTNRHQEEARILNHLVHLLKHSYAVPHWLSATPDLSSPFRENNETAHVIALVVNIASAVIDGLSNRDMELNGFVVMRRNYGGIRLGKLRPSDLAFHSWLSRPEMSQLYVAVADLLAHRVALDTAITARRLQTGKSKIIHAGMIKSMVKFLKKPPLRNPDNLDIRSCPERLLEFMQAVLLTRWDRSPIIRRTSHVGGALEMLRGLYQSRKDFGLEESWFVMSFISEALDAIDVPFEWLEFKPDTTKIHILQFPFLFPSLELVKYFRSLNLKIMKQSHEKAMGTYANGKSQLLLAHWKVNNVTEVLDRTRPHMARYFVMTIRRENMLEDAIGQIWRRERQELTRPLKVRMGVDDGELGLDHGGVQQEFFRLAFAEALDPKYGLFEINPTTRASWFKLGSVEPVYKYQALGVLMSLAIYNGVTVPVTMPLAFYRRILDLPVTKVEHIEDGWPELAHGFKQMLEWEDGDVGDVMCRTYEFSYEAFGRHVNIDMTKKDSLLPAKHVTSNDPSSNIGVGYNSAVPEDAPLVTNANRRAFVKAYIDQLTHKAIQLQLDSFLSGLFTLLAKQSLCLFPPTTLKLLFEGHPTSQPINVDEWQAATTYEDYTITDPVVVWFWDVLRNNFSQAQLRNLLEFVTASNRIPVSGWSGITFIIQRNAAGNEWLPGSSTCYGRLFLPEYTSKEILREKLGKAVETSLGFGMV